MSYRDSGVDKKLRKWFRKDETKSLLKSIRVSKGAIRGLSKTEFDFTYPITAIAGRNGSGKSTLLALACCAFHNGRKGFKLPRRKLPYYTFADFFIFHGEDTPTGEIQVIYGISHNNWRKTADIPDGKGIGYQTRKKTKDGRWNNYASRVHRDVVFLGIERIVPHNEKSQSKSYSRAFEHVADEGWEDEVALIVGRIIGKSYTDFRYAEHSTYRLPIVRSEGRTYSGFNMGAGENALFEVFSILHTIAPGGLLVIDEIELGLHAIAQKRFIVELKKVCLKRKFQIICTTHSKEIFSQLPGDARMYLDRYKNETTVLKGISPEYAFSKLSAENSREISIFVEDKVAYAILMAVMDSSLRSRVTVEHIGSAGLLSRQLAASYNRSTGERILIIFDGDQKSNDKKIRAYCYEMSEAADKDQFMEWCEEHMSFMPGKTWPEAWLIQGCMEDAQTLADLLTIDEDELMQILEDGLRAGKHNEFYEIGSQVGLAEEEVLSRIVLSIKQTHSDEFDEIIDVVETMLDTLEI